MESPTPQPAPGSATFMEGCKDSLPIVISYIPVAFAFGLNATRLGFSPLESVFFSCIIYAGASQFVITAMLFAMFCMARHCVAVLFSVCKNRKPPCGRLA